jgi:uncharacterized protein
MKVLFFALSSLLFTTITSAASFDCSKASTNIEKLICSNSVIGQLDKDLSILYKDKRLSNEGIVQEQREWIRKRNDCKDESCIENIYRIRILELTNASSNNTNISSEAINSSTTELIINNKQTDSTDDVTDTKNSEDQSGIISYAPFILLALGVLLWIMIFRHIKYLHTMYGGKYLIALIVTGFIFGAFTSNELSDFFDEVITYHTITVSLLILYFVIKAIIAIVNSDEFKRGRELANYQIGGKRTSSNSSSKSFTKPIFGGAEPPKPKASKASLFTNENNHNDSIPRQKAMTPISASNKMCATCALWSGERDIDSGRIAVRVSASNSKGKCMGGGHNQQQTPATGTCRMHEKWSALR